VPYERIEEGCASMVPTGMDSSGPVA
jgi:hypothetical protein